MISSLDPMFTDELALTYGKILAPSLTDRGSV